MRAAILACASGGPGRSPKWRPFSRSGLIQAGPIGAGRARAQTRVQSPLGADGRSPSGRNLPLARPGGPNAQHNPGQSATGAAALINGLPRPPISHCPASVPPGARALLGLSAALACAGASAQPYLDGEGCSLTAKALFGLAGLSTLSLAFVGLVAVVFLSCAAVRAVWDSAVDARAQQLAYSSSGRCPWCGCVGPGFHLSPRPADYCHHDQEVPS